MTRPNRYEPDVNATYQEMAAHYGVAVIPARTYKPRDKVWATDCTSYCDGWEDVVSVMDHGRRTRTHPAARRRVA